MKKLLACVPTLLILASVMAARPRAPIPHFQVTLERTAKGWQAKCDSGCAWTELSVVCGDTCRVLVDASGVTVNSKEERTDATFGFVVSRAEKGWQAVSLAGTAWTTLAWRCAVVGCRARIDESGVTAQPQWRFGRSE